VLFNNFGAGCDASHHWPLSNTSSNKSAKVSQKTLENVPKIDPIFSLFLFDFGYLTTSLFSKNNPPPPNRPSLGDVKK